MDRQEQTDGMQKRSPGPDASDPDERIPWTVH